MKKCPLTRRKCWGAECAWWSSVPLVGGDTHEDCAIKTNISLGVTQVARTEGVQEVLEHSRNDTARMQHAVLGEIQQLPKTDNVHALDKQ